MSMAANLIIACVCVFCGYKLGERATYKAVVEASKKLRSFNREDLDAAKEFLTYGPAEEEAAT